MHYLYSPLPCRKLALLLLACGWPVAAKSETLATQTEAFGNLPLAFEANHGQADSQVRFVARGRGVTFLLTTDELIMLPDDRHDESVTLAKRTQPKANSPVRIKFSGSNRRVTARGLKRLPGTANYFIGNDPRGWLRDIPTYSEVSIEGVYPGIDLVYHGNQRRLEYDFVLAPGATPDAIDLAFDGVQSVAVDGGGDLLLRTSAGVVRQHKPVLYQEKGGRRVEVAGMYRMHQGRVGFEALQYDSSQPLVIDPVLAYSTYMGGSNADHGYGIAVDAAGSAYITGYTNSTNFPVQAPYQGSYRGGSTDTFVIKLSPAGNAAVYSTYLGGSSIDNVSAIAVDSSGAAYVAGVTYSADFPLQAPFQSANTGVAGFVTKLSPAGNSLLYSTFLGSATTPMAIAVDAAGSAFVAGETTSSTFPVVSAFQPTFHSGSRDGFVTKFSAAGDHLVYSTYLGGGGWDTIQALALDSAGSAYVAGYTMSTDFPTHAPIQASYGGGTSDAFVAKLSPAGNALLYSTYLGGSLNDKANGIAVDGAGSAYVTGQTSSTNFPTKSAYQATHQGGTYDAFVTKLSPAGESIIYSTYLGSNGTDYGYAIAVNQAGEAYVTGGASGGGAGFPNQSACLSYSGGGGVVFVTKFASAGNTLAYSALVGPGTGYGIAVDSSNSVYVTGETGSNSFPILSAFQSTPRGSTEAVAFKLVTPVTLATAPPGLTVLADALPYAAAKSFDNWCPGEVHSISVNSPQQASGARYAFSGWSDGGAQTHNITSTSTPTTYTATFSAQYQLTTNVAPAGAGTIAVSPASGDGYYNAGASVMLTATPSAGFRFTGWTGDANGTNPATSITISAARTVTANFAPVGACNFSLSATSANVGSGSGTTGTSLTGSFSVLSSGTCTAADTWTAVSDSPRLIITSAASGNGATSSATITFMMFTNSTTLPRTAHIAVAGQTFTATQAGSTETQSQRVVRALYQTILGREPDSGGWAFWTGSGAPTNNQGAVLYNQMADGFYGSPEFRDSGFAVIGIYKAVTASLPTFNGWNSLVSQIRRGVLTTTQLTDQIAAGMPATQFVQQAIQNACRRTPTSTEVNNYAAQLTNGTYTSRFDFLNRVIFTDSDYRDETNDQYLLSMFFTILVRDPDPAGFAFWTGQLTNPPGMPGIYYIYLNPAPAYAMKLAIIGQAVPPNPALLGFLGSPEFQGLIQ